MHNQKTFAITIAWDNGETTVQKRTVQRDEWPAANDVLMALRYAAIPAPPDHQERRVKVVTVKDDHYHVYVYRSNGELFARGMACVEALPIAIMHVEIEGREPATLAVTEWPRPSAVCETVANMAGCSDVCIDAAKGDGTRFLVSLRGDGAVVSRGTVRVEKAPAEKTAPFATAA